MQRCAAFDVQAQKDSKLSNGLHVRDSSSKPSNECHSAQLQTNLKSRVGHSYQHPQTRASKYVTVISCDINNVLVLRWTIAGSTWIVPLRPSTTRKKPMSPRCTNTLSHTHIQLLWLTSREIPQID